MYPVVAHWAFAADGWLFARGVRDFAGGLVVHINAGIAALALVFALGPRQGFGTEAIRPHSLPLTLLGTGILWFGWFGFNAGSALAADGLAVNAFVTTQIAAAVAALGWVVAEWLRNGKPTTLGAASGAVAGLVAITPCAGFVSPLAAMAIGLLAGVICFWAVSLKFRFGYDDSLDVVGGPPGRRHRRLACCSGSSPRRRSTRRPSTGSSAVAPSCSSSRSSPWRW